MTSNTLKITFAQASKHRKAARDRLRRAESEEHGESIEQSERFILNFEDFDDVERLMRTSNLSLLEAIVDEQPESIRETAAIVDRDYREVHRNLEELESLGVIEFESSGSRKRPMLRAGARTIDFSFRLDREGRGGQPGVSA